MGVLFLVAADMTRTRSDHLVKVAEAEAAKGVTPVFPSQNFGVSFGVAFEAHFSILPFPN